MIRLKELKQKKYNPKYEELYKFLYSISIDGIIDCSKTENEPDALHIIIYDNMKEELRIRKVFNDYIISVNLVEDEPENNYQYQKVEYYRYKELSQLIIKLKELLNKLAGIITIEYDNRPHQKIYDLLTYAKLGVIGDDSGWIRGYHNELNLTLMDDKISKIIFVDYSSYNQGRYRIGYKDYDEEDNSSTFAEYFHYQFYDTEDELVKALKEMIQPCLRTKRIRDIGTKYNSASREINKFIKTPRKIYKKKEESVC